ncbi:alpha/beta hydrolase [Thalassospiraceae bacterium LMO-JJ14]|nr:alpha/beta hydrolase [Thalassospiraceae bacterium LMO-JJ14]
MHCEPAKFILRSFSTILLCAVLAGCVTTSPRTGFVTATPLAQPTAGRHEGEMPPIAVKNPASAVVIVYSHGTRRPQYKEDCSRWGNSVPDSVLSLEQNDGFHVFFLCSNATDNGIRGSYIYSRAREIDGILDQLIAAGVQPRNIFLAGHSAGAWSSLMAARNSERKYNAAILFAPACCGPRYEETIYPEWRGMVRPTQVREISSAQRLNALVYGYPDDDFNRPQELRFLTEAYPETVTLMDYSCGSGHMTHLRDCRAGETADQILSFIRARTAAYRGS